MNSVIEPIREVTQLKPNTHHFSIPFVEDKIDLRSIYFTLMSEKWLILAVALITMVLGSIYAIMKTPQYQANVLLQIEKKDTGTSLLNASSLMGSLNSSASPADVQTALIKSPFILVPVVESLGLDISSKPHYLPYVGAWIARHHSGALGKPWFGLNRYAWGGEHIQLANMSIPRIEEGKVFKLVAGEKNTYQVYAPSGQLMLQAKVGQLAQIKENGEIKLKILVKSLEANPGTEFFFSKQSTYNIASGIGAGLHISDLGLSYQIDKAGILQISLIGASPQYVVDLLNTIAKIAVEKDIERKSMEAGKVLVFLNEQLPLIKSSLNSAEITLNQYQRQKNALDLTVKSRELLNQLTLIQKEIEKADLNRAILLHKDTPLHPDVIALEDKKATLQAQLIAVENQLQTLPPPGQKIISLTRDIKVKSRLYMELLHKIQELNVVKAGIVSDIRILNLAEPPNSALPLGRGIAIAGSLLVGLVLGSLLVFVRKVFHRTVDDPNWLEQHFGIPTFAIVPFSKDQNDNVRAYKEKNRKELHILAQTNPRDLSIEALRSLRTSLQFALMGAKNNIITILGISPSIGKSFVSVNFSHILADTGKRILLIDGDIRKGYLHQYFGEGQKPGLSEAISGEVALADAIRHTHLANLDIITAGTYPPNPSELLMSERFSVIMAELSPKYDLVIIDTAPILAVTDGAVIASHAAVNFLVVASGKHQAEEIELSMKRLQSNHVRVQGTIFNNLSATAHGQGRFNYYYAYGDNK